VPAGGAAAPQREHACQRPRQLPSIQEAAGRHRQGDQPSALEGKAVLPLPIHRLGLTRLSLWC
jgi:hypothetical protein